MLWTEISPLLEICLHCCYRSSLSNIWLSNFSQQLFIWVLRIATTTNCSTQWIMGAVNKVQMLSSSDKKPIHHHTKNWIGSLQKKWLSYFLARSPSCRPSGSSNKKLFNSFRWIASFTPSASIWSVGETTSCLNRLWNTGKLGVQCTAPHHSSNVSCSRMDSQQGLFPPASR